MEFHFLANETAEALCVTMLKPLGDSVFFLDGLLYLKTKGEGGLLPLPLSMLS